MRVSAAEDRGETPALTVVGSGSMAVALASVASERASCRLVCEDEQLADEIVATRRFEARFGSRRLSPSFALVQLADLSGAMDSAWIIAVPSARFRETVCKVAGHIGPNSVVVSATKGLEPGSLKRMTEVLEEETSTSRIGALAGPNLTHDLLDGLPTALVVASDRREVVEACRSAMQSEVRYVLGSDDVVGLELVGVLKNVIGLGIGIGSGLELGDNGVSLLMGAGFSELWSIGLALGVSPQTLSGIAGIGDLHLVATSKRSLNRELGILLGSGAPLGEILTRLPERPEGLNSIAAFSDLKRRANVETPLCDAICSIVLDEVDARTALLSAFRSLERLDGHHLSPAGSG